MCFEYKRICFSQQFIGRPFLKIMGNFEIFCGFGIFLLMFYRYLIATFDFWKKRGIPGPKPVLPFGTMKDAIFRKNFMGHYIKDIYDAYDKTPFIGMFKMREPVLIIKDPKIIKDVLLKDSSIFCNRQMDLCKKVRLFPRCYCII